MAETWRARGWLVTVDPTRAAGHATELARQAAQAGFALVLAAGGDGTLGEVANGLAYTDVVMGVLPMGTANSFARELGLPRPGLWTAERVLAASQALTRGRVQRIDLGYTHDQAGGNGRYWLLWSGMGADGVLVSHIEPRPKWSKRLGVWGYIGQGLTVLPRMPDIAATVTIDGRTYADEYVLVLLSNCRLYAGGHILLSPQAQLDDGQWEVWFFRGRGPIDTMTHIYRCLRGQHLHSDQAMMVQGKVVTVETAVPIPCQRDGDKAGHTPLHCEIKPGALRLLVPPTTPTDLFCQPGATFPLT